MSLTTAYYHSPIGWLGIAAGDSGLAALKFREAPPENPFPEVSGAAADAVTQLKEYFENRRQVFELPLAPQGSAFQLRVWEALQKIPFGQTASYQDIATAIGEPRAVRAVGSANGRNPLAIIVPCHRIIGSDGRLTGYGGGIWRKEWLLRHERSVLV